jgi:hypothetical protein
LEQVTLWWLTDNQNVEKMLAKGSGKLRIMKLVLDILKRGRALLLDLQPVWFSRDNPFLLKADAISKGINTDNWEVSRSDYDHLNALFGPFSIDLLATCDNAKATRFYSRSWEIGTQGVDSFAQNWQGECAYVAPSFPGNANYLQDSNYCNVWNFDYPVMEEFKILDICFQGQNPFEFHV